MFVPVHLLGFLGADHVMVLETEIQNLKDKLKTLEEQIEDVLDPAKRSSSYADVQPSVHCPAEAPGKSPRLLLLHALPTDAAFVFIGI